MADEAKLWRVLYLLPSEAQFWSSFPAFSKRSHYPARDVGDYFLPGSITTSPTPVSMTFIWCKYCFSLPPPPNQDLAARGAFSNKLESLTGGRQKAHAVSDPFLHHSSRQLSRHWRKFENEMRERVPVPEKQTCQQFPPLLQPKGEGERKQTRATPNLNSRNQERVSASYQII